MLWACFWLMLRGILMVSLPGILSWPLTSSSSLSFSSGISSSPLDVAGGGNGTEAGSMLALGTWAITGAGCAADLGDGSMGGRGQTTMRSEVNCTSRSTEMQPLSFQYILWA